MKFQERFSEVLKESKFTQKELAIQLHIDPTNISNWKKGKNYPSIDILYKLCKLLGESSDYLLGLKDE